MSKSSALILLGVLTVLAPFSGLPASIRSLLAVVFGACVLGIGFSLRPREQRSRVAESRPSEPSPVAPVAATPEPEPVHYEPPRGVSPI